MLVGGGLDALERVVGKRREGVSSRCEMVGAWREGVAERRVRLEKLC